MASIEYNKLVIKKQKPIRRIRKWKITKSKPQK